MLIYETTCWVGAMYASWHVHINVQLTAVMAVIALSSSQLWWWSCCYCDRIVVVAILGVVVAIMVAVILHCPSWSCHCHHIHSGTCIAIVAIAVAAREALPAANTTIFPTEGAVGLASNSQAWLREPQLQSPRHCSPGQRQRRNTDPRCPW
jgi:hypothetical protein